MARVRLAADVDADLRRRVKVAAASGDKTVGEWIEEAVLAALEREARAEAAGVSRASVPAFARDWDSEDDADYDQLAG